MANQAPRSCAGYNDRAKQLQDFKAAWMFRNVNQHDIWNDMGLSRMMGIQFEKSFSFLIKNGRAEDFLRLPDSGQQKLLLEQGKASLFPDAAGPFGISIDRKRNDEGDRPGLFRNACL